MNITISRVWRRSSALALSFILAAAVSVTGYAQDRIKPFVLAATSEVPVDEAVIEASAQLSAAGFDVLAEFSPYDNARVIAFTSSALQTAAQATELGGFAAVLRASVTEVDGVTQLAYLNPQYLAQAYRLESDLADVSAALASALGAEQEFGSKRGLKPKKLRKYHYMMGMEYFDDPYVLGEFDTQDAALAAVSAGLADNEVGVSPLYQLTLPDSGATVFGVSMTGEGDKGKFHDDGFQMEVVDFGELRSTAYLPYQILVEDGSVRALHMRFRMAVFFPDLSMMGKHSFMTLMPSPKAIQQTLEAAVQAGVAEQ